MFEVTGNREWIQDVCESNRRGGNELVIALEICKICKHRHRVQHRGALLAFHKYLVLAERLPPAVGIQLLFLHLHMDQHHLLEHPLRVHRGSKSPSSRWYLKFNSESRLRVRNAMIYALEWGDLVIPVLSSLDQRTPILRSSLRQTLPLHQESIRQSKIIKDLPTQTESLNSCPTLNINASHVPFLLQPKEPHN